MIDDGDFYLQKSRDNDLSTTHIDQNESFDNR